MQSPRRMELVVVVVELARDGDGDWKYICIRGWRRWREREEESLKNTKNAPQNNTTWVAYASSVHYFNSTSSFR